MHDAARLAVGPLRCSLAFNSRALKSARLAKSTARHCIHMCIHLLAHSQTPRSTFVFGDGVGSSGAKA